MHSVPQNVTLFTNKPGNIRNCRQPTEAERGREQNLEKKIWYTGQHLGWMKHFSAHTGTFYISFKLFISLCYKDPKHLATLTEAGHSPSGQSQAQLRDWAYMPAQRAQSPQVNGFYVWKSRKEANSPISSNQRVKIRSQMQDTGWRTWFRGGRVSKPEEIMRTLQNSWGGCETLYGHGMVVLPVLSSP